MSDDVKAANPREMARWELVAEVERLRETLSLREAFERDQEAENERLREEKERLRLDRNQQHLDRHAAMVKGERYREALYAAYDELGQSDKTAAVDAARITIADALGDDDLARAALDGDGEDE